MKRDKVNDFGLLMLRIFLASILAYYGSQKMFGLFGGEGIQGTISAFEKQGFPQWLTMMAIVAESAGSLAVLLGLLTRLAAFGIACTMATASYEMLMMHMHYPDAHLPLALCGIALALIFTGAGTFSLDYMLTGGRRKKRASS